MAGVISRFVEMTDTKILEVLPFLKCVVLPLNLYMSIQIFSSISSNIGFWNTHFHVKQCMSVNILPLFVSGIIMDVAHNTYRLDALNNEKWKETLEE